MCLTSDILKYPLHTAGMLVSVLLLAIQGLGGIQSSSGDLSATARAGVAAMAAAAAAAAGGRERRPPAGTCLRPVCLHDFLLWFKDRVIPAPRLSGRRGRRACDSPEARILMLDVLHLYPLAGVERAGRLVSASLALWSDSRCTHGSVSVLTKRKTSGKITDNLPKK